MLFFLKEFLQLCSWPLTKRMFLLCLIYLYIVVVMCVSVCRHACLRVCVCVYVCARAVIVYACAFTQKDISISSEY